MHQIPTPSAPTQAVSPAASPPPLPVPTPGAGREEIPAQQPAVDQQTRSISARVRGCGSVLGSPLRTYLVFMVFFTALWALGGGGHFWPVWPMLGWGMGLVMSGQVPLGVPRRPSS